MVAAAPADPSSLAGLIGEATALGRTVHVKARGESMRPLIPDGSTIELVALTRAPRVGDVVAVGRGRSLLIHRVHRIDGELLTTHGDGARQADPPIQRESVLGLARRVITPRGWTARLDTPSHALFGRLMVMLVQTIRR